MISVIFVKNPFDTSQNKIQQVPFAEGKAVRIYTEPHVSYYPDTEFHISINGHLLEKYEVTLLYPADGDQIVIVPVVGKSLGSLLGSIAMMALSFYVGGPNFLPNMHGWAKALVQGLTMYVGGRIINAILPPPKQKLSSSTTSPTYGWDGAKPIAATGTPIGKTFGTVKPSPVILARHVITDGDKQYLNILYGGGEGPIDSIQDITIDGNPIENYKDVQVDIRLGTNDQEPIENFGDTFADQSLSYELQNYSDWKANTNYVINTKIKVDDSEYNCITAGKSGSTQPTWSISGTVTDGTVVWSYSGSKWATQQTEGNAGRGLEIMLELPYGLYYTKDDGKLTKGTVKVKAQYRKVDDATWTDWPLIDDGATDPYIGMSKMKRWLTKTAVAQGKITLSKYNGAITASKNTAVRRVYRMDGLDPAKYEVRCQCYYKQGTSTRYSTRVYWSQLSHILYNDFARPNKVLVGIRALATDQLSGSDPNVGWTQTRSKVNVWNPATNQYEQKLATNPYWAVYDMIHNCKYLKNINTGQYEYVVEGNPISRIDYPAFSENAIYSTELDSEGDPRFELNLYIDTEISFWDALARIAVVGRGIIIPKGTKYSCICDKPAIPSQLFTMGNITEKSFKGKFQSVKDRSQCIEVDFYNELKDYKQDLAIYYGDEYNKTTQIPNPTKVTRYGISKYKYAYREAVFLFKGNKYLKRTVTWEADIDAIACKPGDVVLVAHDVPKWGAASGRIVAATTTTVTLDQQVTLLPGKTYAVEIRLKTDNRVNRIIASITQETTTNTLTLAAPFTTVPERYDIFAVGESYKVTKPVKVTNIVKSKDLKCKLSGVEYIEDMYSDVIDIPIINYSSFDNTLTEVQSLSTGQETYRQKDGTVVSVIHCSWMLPRKQNIRGIKVWYTSDDGETWQDHQSPNENYTTIAGVKSLETYLVKICTVNELGIVSPGIISETIYITGKDQPPSDVPSLTVAVDPADTTKINLSWSAIDDIDLRGYQIAEGSTVLTVTPITDTRYTYTATSSREYSFNVVAIDNSGNPSLIPTTKTISVTIEPAQVAGFLAVLQDTDRSRLNLSWQGNFEQDISYYEIRVGDDWEHSTLIATQLKANTYTHVLTAEGSQNFMIKAVNIAGYQSAQSVGQRLQIILRPDTVTNLQAAQEPRDRSMVKVTWTASPGKDIAGYELRYGNDWASGTLISTVKESTYWWYIPASGTYNIMVQARTVAGYVSNIANVTIAAMIEAYDVTGFGAMQLITDRTKIRLSWDQPLSLDVAYFEIRKGTTWDTGIVVGQRVTGTYYEVIVTEETAQTFWIKSVTVAGNYSQNPAKVEGIFNMNPDPITNIVLNQDTNDRSVLNISFTGISESDLVAYEIRVGYAWDTAVKIGETKELRWTYKPPTTGDVKIMIKSKNAAGYYSDEASENIYVMLEPATVTGLQVLQNGEYNELFWDKHLEPDVVAYEIREGASFELGALVASGVTLNSYAVKVDVERNYRYHIKAINRANKYSINAVTQSVFVENLPPKNVILTYNDITLQTGTMDNVEFGQSLINWSNIGGKFSDYPTTKFSDIGGQNVLKLLKSDGVYPSSGTYTCQTIDVGQIITANISMRFISSVILRGTGSAVLQTRTSRDGITWTAWQDFRPAQYTFRYLDRMIILGTTDPTKTPEVNQITTSIDVDDLEAVGSVLIPVGGDTISYGKNFYTVPVVTPMALGDNKFPQVLSKTDTEFTVKVVNRAGTDVGGQLDWRAKGY